MGFVIPLVMFAALAVSTPGPNTLLLASSGANFGFRRTLPYSLGIVAGRSVLQVCVIAFLGVLFATTPELQTVLRVAGSVYLVYLSYKIATARPASAAERPLTFAHGALYQFVNAKVWANATTAVSVFVQAGDGYYARAAILVVAFATLSFFANCAWTLFGMQIRRVLRSPAALRHFNYSMGALNAACILLIWL
jgi:threonine/homoserine/homoserine lactone efflux protein